jgi:5-methylcytosine-specific restriction protein A
VRRGGPRLNRNEFSTKVKRAASIRANGRCEECGLPFKGRPEYDHKLPCALGGDASLENCHALCGACHEEKTKADVKSIRKADRQRNANVGAKAAARPIPQRMKENAPERAKSEGMSEIWRRFQRPGTSA